MNPADYKIKLWCEPLMGAWSYEITTPDGRTLRPVIGICMRRETIEAAAWKRIEIDMATETISGDELADRVAKRPDPSVHIAAVERGDVKLC